MKQSEDVVVGTSASTERRAFERGGKRMFYDPKANIVLLTKDGYEFRVWDHFLKAGS
jgi:fructose 1,6-bisphosphatase